MLSWMGQYWAENLVTGRAQESGGGFWDRKLIKPLDTCRNLGEVTDPPPDMESGTQSTEKLLLPSGYIHTVSLRPLCWGHYLHSQGGSRGSVGGESSHGIWTPNFLLHSKYSSSTSAHWLTYFCQPYLVICLSGFLPFFLCTCSSGKVQFKSNFICYSFSQALQLK